jgi:hypothetical protein
MTINPFLIDPASKPTDAAATHATSVGEAYLTQMRAYVDGGGRLSHQNGIDLLHEVEALSLLMRNMVTAAMHPRRRPDDAVKRALDSVTADEAFAVLGDPWNLNFGSIAQTHMPLPVDWSRARAYERANILGQWLRSELIRVAAEGEQLVEWDNLGGTND